MSLTQSTSNSKGLMDDEVLSPSKKPRSPRTKSGPSITMAASTIRSRRFRENQKKIVQNVKQMEEVGLPVPQDLHDAMQKIEDKRKVKARKQVEYRAQKRAEMSNESMNLNEMETRIEAEREEREEHEKNLRDLKLQLDASNEQAKIEKKIQEEMKAQLSELNKRGEEKERKIKKLELELSIATKLSRQAIKYQEETKSLKTEVESLHASTSRYQKKARSAERELQAAKQTVSELLQERANIFKLDDIKCVICHEIMWTPLTLTCMHSFCPSCLENSFIHGARPHKCPLCRTTTNIPREDKSLRDLIEKVANFLGHLSPPNRTHEVSIQDRFHRLFRASRRNI